jgi:hypothetical protein
LSVKTLRKERLSKGKRLKYSFEAAKALFSVGKEKIVKCQDDFNVYSDDKVNHAKVCKVINGFLCELPDGTHTILELHDLERLQKAESGKTHARFVVL